MDAPENNNLQEMTLPNPEPTPEPALEPAPTSVAPTPEPAAPAPTASTEKPKTTLILAIVAAVLLAGAIAYIVWDAIRDGNRLAASCSDSATNITGTVADKTDDKATTEEATFSIKPLGEDISFMFSEQSLSIDGKYLSVEQAQANSYREFNFTIADCSGDDECTTVKTGDFVLGGDVKFITRGGVGQDAGGEVIAFVLVDGSVYYIPVLDALENNSISLKKVPGVEKVAYATNASVFQSGAGGYATIILWRADGSYYNFAEQTEFTL